MKQEDFFTIMDCASEQDITEMMQHRRSRQIPSGKEDIMTKQTEQTTKKDIHMSRRGVAAGTAVAAALLAVNVGGGYLLLHGRDSEQAASTPDSAVSSMTDGIEEVTGPRYCRLMQEFYTVPLHEPCDYDFTGMGMDLNETWEDDAYRITVTAVAGCDWVLYYFYDVEPKQGQAYDEYWNWEGAYTVNLTVGNELGSSYSAGILPIRNDRTDSSVWHCMGLLSNTTGEPFFTGYEEKPQLRFGVHLSDEEPDTEFAAVEPAFSVQAYPLQSYVPTELFDILSENAYINRGESGMPDPQGVIDRHLPVRSAVTPFGIFCYGDTYEETEYPGICSMYMFGLATDNCFSYSAYDQLGKFILQDADGNALAETAISQASTYGLENINGKAHSFVNMLFRTPLDLSQSSQLAYSTEPVELNAPADLAADAPEYVQRMQAYYDALTDLSWHEGGTYAPCNYDFTGLGKDIDLTFEWDDYNLNYRAVVGCDWVLYYFFDVEPKQGQDYEQFLNDFPDVQRVDISLVKGNERNTSFSRFESRVISVEDPQLDNGVWHCMGIICNVTGKPFFHGENAGTQISISMISESPEETQEEPAGEVFDFETKEYPLCEAEPPVITLKPDLPPARAAAGDPETKLKNHPMTRCAETPFGRFYVSEPYSTGADYEDMCHWVGADLNMEGIAPAELDAVHFGVFKDPVNGNDYLIALYDRPVETE